MRAILHGEDFKQALSQVEAVRQIRPWGLINDLGPDRVNAMLEIRLTAPTTTPEGWTEFRTLIHAMVGGEDGEPATPLCAWNQSGEKATERGRAKGHSCEFLGAKGLNDWAIDASKRLCGKCRPKLPASFLVVAKAAGLYEEPA